VFGDVMQWSGECAVQLVKKEGLYGGLFRGLDATMGKTFSCTCVDTHYHSSIAYCLLFLVGMGVVK